MTEKEIIKMLKTNERGFMFLPEEVKEWADKHRCNMRKFTYTDMSWTTPPDVFCESNVYRLMPDYSETAPLPELEMGLYFLQNKDDKTWKIAVYVGNYDGFYKFAYNNNVGMITINPAKWDIKKIVTENVQ